MASKTHQDILLMRWALFSIAGIALIVVLYSVGVTPSWSFALRKAMAQAPFLLCILLTLGAAYNLLMMRGILRKSAVLAAFLLLLACFTPALGLWGVFFNFVPCLLSAGTAGLLAILWPLPAKPEQGPLSSHE